jgi:hypothetical protein
MVASILRSLDMAGRRSAAISNATHGPSCSAGTGCMAAGLVLALVADAISPIMLAWLLPASPLVLAMPSPA